MKNYRIPAAAAAIALGLSASVAMALPAAAADTYVVDGDLGVEGATYPDNTWFTGNPQPTTAPAFTEDGLVLTGQTQLLYGTAAAPIGSGAAFVEWLSGASVDADGNWFFQVPLFLDGGAEPSGFTTLRPAAAGNAGISGDWITSQNFGDYPANSTLTLDQIATVIDEALGFEDNPVLLAYGVFVEEGSTTTVASVTWSGDTSFFTAEPEEEVVEPETPETPEVAPPATAVEDTADFTG